MKECLNYKKIDTENVQCFACNHRCQIKNGRVGICGVRKNINGKLNLLVYGKASAAHIDPIEKKPLFHFLPGSSTYSIGTIGCNFRCDNCQNYDISQMFDAKGDSNNYENLNWGYNLSADTIVAEAIKNKCASIAYTYNEPTIWFEYGLDIMKAAKKNGLKNVWISNGFMSPETLDLILPYIDAYNIDIKSFDEKFYQSNCGAHIEPILENCRRLIKEKKWLEITTLIIPTLSDNDDMLRSIARFIAKDLGDNVPWHVTSFFGSISWKLKKLTHTSNEIIKKVIAIGREEGLKFVYGGNIIDSDMENTYCPQCKNLLVSRHDYGIVTMYNKGKCPNCGYLIEGIF